MEKSCLSKDRENARNKGKGKTDEESRRKKVVRGRAEE